MKTELEEFESGNSKISSRTHFVIIILNFLPTVIFEAAINYLFQFSGNGEIVNKFPND